MRRAVATILLLGSLASCSGCEAVPDMQPATTGKTGRDRWIRRGAYAERPSSGMGGNRHRPPRRRAPRTPADHAAIEAAEERRRVRGRRRYERWAASVRD